MLAFLALDPVRGNSSRKRRLFKDQDNLTVDDIDNTKKKTVWTQTRRNFDFYPVLHCFIVPLLLPLLLPLQPRENPRIVIHMFAIFHSSSFARSSREIKVQ